MKRFIIIFASVFVSLKCLSQTVVVTDIPGYTTGDPSAMLEIKSTSKGLLIPKVTLTSSLASTSPVSAPVETGLLVYNEGANQPIGFYYWNGSAWTAVGGSVTADGSETKIISSSPIVTTGSGTTSSHYNISFTTQSINKSTRDALNPSPYAGQYIWCTDCGSGEFQYFNGVTWVNSSGGTRTLAIGEPFQGGKVAYIFQPGDPGYVAGEVRGLIAASSDNTNGVEWGCNSVSITGADGTLIGTGTQNTTDIVTGCGTAGIPARVAFDYSVTEFGVTYRDWFLPSSDELNKLYLNRSAIGGFTTSNPTYYYSSSEVSSTLATTINFNNGTPTSSAKAPSPATNYRSRAVRYFTGGTPDNLQIGTLYLGGRIAYILQPADIGYVAGQVHGLITTVDDVSTGAPWGCQSTPISGADGQAIGTGNQNTIDIEAGCSSPGIASDYCANLVQGGYSDWYLPSLQELVRLYDNRLVIGGFEQWSWYWSSSEASSTQAYRLTMNGGTYDQIDKNNYYRIRPVRAF